MCLYPDGCGEECVHVDTRKWIFEIEMSGISTTNEFTNIQRQPLQSYRYTIYKFVTLLILINVLSTLRHHLFVFFKIFKRVDFIF